MITESKLTNGTYLSVFAHSLSRPRGCPCDTCNTYRAMLRAEREQKTRARVLAQVDRLAEFVKTKDSDDVHRVYDALEGLTRADALKLVNAYYLLDNIEESEK